MPKSVTKLFNLEILRVFLFFVLMIWILVLNMGKTKKIRQIIAITIVTFNCFEIFLILSLIQHKKCTCLLCCKCLWKSWNSSNTSFIVIVCHFFMLILYMCMCHSTKTFCIYLIANINLKVKKKWIYFYNMLNDSVFIAENGQRLLCHNLPWLVPWTRN